MPGRSSASAGQETEVARLTSERDETLEPELSRRRGAHHSGGCLCDRRAVSIGWLDMWGQPIRLDPKWNNADYYDKEPPIEGLKAALKIVTLQANSWEWARKTFGTAPAEEGKDPAKAFTNQFKIETFLDQAAAARAAVSDANHFLYLCKANQLASVDPTKIKVPTLVLYASSDLIFYEPIVEDTIQKIAAVGTPVESGTLPGPNGHLNGIAQIGLGVDKIGAFLAQ
jgi:homoserine O-acetyltransferase/O-succinyltransferase